LSSAGICRHKGAPKTNSAGRFSGHFKLYVSAPMFAQYNGDAAHFASASKRIKVTATCSSTAAWLELAPGGGAVQLRQSATRGLATSMPGWPGRLVPIS
jgi:hypothetical protein